MSERAARVADAFRETFEQPGADSDCIAGACAAEAIALAIRALPTAEPEEPTAEMVEAGAHVFLHQSHPSWDAAAAAIYLAMRAARPAGGREGGA